MIDVVFIVERIQDFEYDLGDQIKFFRRTDRVGELINGKTFKVSVYDNRGDWLERLHGLRIREYREMDGVKISPRERLALQAMIQR